MATYRVPDGWVAKGNATNAVATATKAAVPNAKHIVRGVTAGWVGTVTGTPLLTIKIGATAVFEWPCPQAGRNHAFFAGIPGAVNQAVSAELAAGGAGIVGYVTLDGETEAAAV